MKVSSLPVWQKIFLISIARAKIACGNLVAGQAVLEEAIEGSEWQWYNVLIHIAIADAHLQLALRKPKRAFRIREDQLLMLRRAGFGILLAEELLLRGKTLLAIDEVGQARQTLLKAMAAAAEQSEQAILWQILATLSDLERKSGNEVEAINLAEKAREIIDNISEHAGTDEVRSAFLSQPSVMQIRDQR
jgi:tetratricopeptide (TPR) repeat protein